VDIGQVEGTAHRPGVAPWQVAPRCWPPVRVRTSPAGLPRIRCSGSA